MSVINLDQVPTPVTVVVATPFDTYGADIERHAISIDPGLADQLDDLESDILQKTMIEMTSRYRVQIDENIKDGLRRICLKEAKGYNADEATKLRTKRARLESDSSLKNRHLDGLVQIDGSHYDIAAKTVGAVQTQRVINPNSKDEITLYVLGAEVADVERAIRDLKRPVADKLIIAEATRVNYQIAITITTVYGFSTASSSSIRDALITNAQNIGQEIAQVGRGVYVSDFRQVIRDVSGINTIDIRITSQHTVIETPENHLPPVPGRWHNLDHVEVTVN